MMKSIVKLKNHNNVFIVKQAHINAIQCVDKSKTLACVSKTMREAPRIPFSAKQSELFC